MECEKMTDSVWYQILKCETDKYICFAFKQGYGAGISCLEK